MANIYPVIVDRANFGESFGAVNALFSGLALAGVAIAIYLQSQELGLQRDELRLTREELERAASSQEITSRWNQTAGILQFSAAYVELLGKTSADFRKRHSSLPERFGEWPSGNTTNKNSIRQFYRIVLAALLHLDIAADGLEYLQTNSLEPSLRRTCARLIRTNIDPYLFRAFLKVEPIDKWAAWVSDHFLLDPEGFRYGTATEEVVEIRKRYVRYNNLFGDILN